MGRPKKPIAVLKAEGKSHLSKREIAEREENELAVPFVDIEAPAYLESEEQITKFNYYAGMLLKLNIFTELDVDCLAKYIISEQLYLEYTKLMLKLISAEELEQMAKIQVMQDKAFRQCLACARELGLTITSRCKLVIPTPPDDDDEL